MPEKGFDNKQKARMDNPERRKLLPQNKILSLLNVQENDTILDIGAGAGYFTFPLSTKTNSTVYALDMEEDMLDYIQKQIDEQDVKNITTLHNYLDAISLEDSSTDIALASMVLHEVKSIEIALTEIFRVLKVGGRFVAIDWIPEPNDQRKNRIDSGDMKRAAENVGFTFDLLTTPSEKVYALAFDKVKLHSMGGFYSSPTEC